MSRRILLADDSVTIQKVIELTFMDDDYEVRAVGNGDEALAMLTAIQADFVIADVHMPGASGYEVCRRSKQLHPEVPVLLLVGTFEPFDESQARDAGADSFLKKPFDSQELLGRVHDLLARTAPAGPAAPAISETPVEAPAPAAAWHPTPSPFLHEAPAASADEARPIEAASTWQEFELEAEPEPPAAHAATDAPATHHAHADVAPAPAEDPWPALLSVPSSSEAGLRFEQPFALGDLEEPVGEHEPAHEAANAAHASHADVDAGDPAGHPAAAASPAVERPFTLGEPLDDRSFLLDEPDFAPLPSAPSAFPPTPEPPAPFEPAHPFQSFQSFESFQSAAGAAAEPAAEPAAAPEPAPAPTAEAGAFEPTFEERAGSPRDESLESPSLEATEEHVAEHAGHPAFSTAATSAAEALPSLQGHHHHGDAAAAAALSEEDVDRIARRVVELMGDKVVRDVAWEVIPDLAEVVIKDRLRELESQVE